MKVFEKYQKLFNACRKYPEVNLSKRCGTRLPENSNYSVQSGIDTNNDDEKLISQAIQNVGNMDASILKEVDYYA